MNYDELAAIYNRLPRIPRREMRCHPLVIDALRRETQATPPYRKHTDLWRAYDLLACPVFEDPSMDAGAWEILEDGVVTASGNIEYLY